MVTGFIPYNANTYNHNHTSTAWFECNMKIYLHEKIHNERGRSKPGVLTDFSRSLYQKKFILNAKIHIAWQVFNMNFHTANM